MITNELKPGDESRAADEDMMIEEIKTIIVQAAKFASMQAHDENKPQRLFHPKTHGSVEATLKILDNFDPKLAVGIFKPGTTYEAKVRFSNGHAHAQDDSEADIRGMAIKVFVPKDDKLIEQDFLLATHNIFFCPSATEYRDMMAAFIQFNGPQKYFSERLPLAKILKDSQKVINTPLEVQYFSQTPYLLGEGQAVKYSAKPVSAAALEPRVAGPDFLRIALERQIGKQDAVFEFLVQVQGNPKTMPVEDATVPWDEAESKFVPVATLTIKKQASLQNCETLEFNPWHALPEHRPLGVINRIRGAVYAPAAAKRLAKRANRAFSAVMTLKDPCDGLKELKKVLGKNGLVNAFALERIGLVHFARFHVFVDEINGAKLARFAIMTSFDFAMDDYINVFIDELGEVFDELLALMSAAPNGTPTPPGPVKQNRQAFIDYVHAVTIPPAVFYSAYPQLSVQNIRREV